MKKILVIVLAVLLGTIATTNVQAQSLDRMVFNIRTTNMDKAGTRATRDFWRRVGEGKNEQWYRLEGGLLAEFTEAGINNKIVYNRKGGWLYTLKEYGEKELPLEVRAQVRSNFYDYSIGWVKELTQSTNKQAVYIVHIDSPTQWKDLAIEDGDLRIIREFDKQ